MITISSSRQTTDQTLMCQKFPPTARSFRAIFIARLNLIPSLRRRNRIPHEVSPQRATSIHSSWDDKRLEPHKAERFRLVRRILSRRRVPNAQHTSSIACSSLSCNKSHLPARGALQRWIMRTYLTLQYKERRARTNESRWRRSIFATRFCSQHKRQEIRAVLSVPGITRCLPSYKSERIAMQSTAVSILSLI